MVRKLRRLPRRFLTGRPNGRLCPKPKNGESYVTTFWPGVVLLVRNGAVDRHAYDR